jgi:hypothetical protein
MIGCPMKGAISFIKRIVNVQSACNGSLRTCEELEEIGGNTLCMKRIYTLILLSFAITQGHAQLAAGDRILKTGFEFGYLTQKNEYDPASGPEIEASGRSVYGNFNVTTGKMVSNTTAVHYGVNFALNSSKSKNSNGTESTVTSVGVGPLVGVQKFYEIAPNIYYLPEASLGATYYRQKEDDFDPRGTLGVSGGISPFSVGVKVKRNMIVSLNMGRFGFNYNIYKNENDVTGDKTTNSSFAVFANSSSFSTGLIFLLNNKAQKGS